MIVINVGCSIVWCISTLALKLSVSAIFYSWVTATKTEHYLENGIPGEHTCNLYESFLIEPVINLLKHHEVWNTMDIGF